MDAQSLSIRFTHDGTGSPPTAVRRERRSKCKMACIFCRDKKIKCGGGRPCPNCLDHGSECTYPVAQRQQHRLSGREVRALQERLAHVEALLASHTAQLEPQNIPATVTLQEAQQLPNPSSTENARDAFEAASVLARLPGLPHSLESVRVQVLPSPSTSNTIVLPSCPTEISAHTCRSEEDDGSSVVPPEEEITYEYHGPGSFLSICSKSGIEWVQEKTGEVGFARLAKSLTHNISQRLKLESAAAPSRAPEPAPDISWRYVRAYFDEATESTMGIVCRTSFEARLRIHYQQGSMPLAESDPAWYALRNAIFATGCRSNLAKEPSSGFLVAHRLSWKYFQNALSVYTELQFARTGLMAVQALAVMSFYVEGIESPALDYMLISSAMRLAEAKGLHRQPAAAWNLSKKAIQTRSCIWWSIYVYDRLISFRSGRPLGIGDENINCQLPTVTPERGNACLELFICTINHAKISSQIATAIATMKNSNPELDKVISTMADLDRSLKSWRDQLPSYIDFDKPVDAERLPHSVRPQHFFYLLYSYYGSLIAIYSILVQPWNAIAIRVDQSQKELLGWEVKNSSDIIVEASRKVIEHLPHIKVDPSTPKWLVLTFPLTALFNLFVHVLRHPTLPTTESDITLMYTASGHFSYLEFLSPELNFPLTRELANLARKAVSEGRKKSKQLNTNASLSLSRVQPSKEACGTSWPLFYDPFPSNSFGMADFNNEDWGTLLVRDEWNNESGMELLLSGETPML